MQTSDGAECGLLKNLALTCVVSSDSPEEPVLHVLGDCGMQPLEDITPCTVSVAEKVFVNGRWVGVFYDHNAAVAIVATLKQLRRGQLIHGEVSLVAIFIILVVFTLPYNIWSNLGRIDGMRKLKMFELDLKVAL